MERLKKIAKTDLGKTIITIVLLSFAINFVIETVSRKGLSAGLAYLIGQPLVFFYNMLIILATLSIAILVKRRLFVYIVVGGTWLGIGITNGIILSNRMTPFTTKDLQVLEDGLSIVPNYLSTKEIIMACVAIVLAVAFLVFIFIKGPKRKEKMNVKRYLASFAIIMLLMAGSSGLAIKTGVVETFFGNLAYAYRDFGFPYCFINTWVNTGVNRPYGYSEDAVKNIFA
ncbi:MAG: LTA synthase family protein, partial [Firmicutes bacterium]|nr:LTA synthase family protein [Bacillota bacterium]